MNANLQDRVVLITGASGGIGSAVARQFAAEGARLVLHYRRHKQAVVKLRRELSAVETVALGADLTQEAEVRGLLTQAHRAFGRLDTVVANAGIWVARERPLHQMTLAQWQRTLDTDLTAVFLTCREYCRIVKKQKRGNMVLVSSTAGIFGEAGHADYAAAKSALAYGFTRTLKNELNRLAPHTGDYCGGRVNCVCRGWTITPMTQKYLREERLVQQAVATMALPQLARVEDVANTIVFLASDTLARHLTGQILVVAGGMEGRCLWQPAEVDVRLV